MITENLIRELIEKNFSEYREFNLIILIGFSLLAILVSIFQTIFISKKIEKYKSELKKNELKFSIYNQKQIESLSNFFFLLTEFKKITSIIRISENKSPESYKQIAIEWTQKFYAINNLFSREKYILPKKIKAQYLLIVENFDTIFDFIKAEKDYKANLYTDELGEVISIQDNYDENILIGKIKQFNREDMFKNTIKNIEEIREEIEIHFEYLE